MPREPTENELESMQKALEKEIGVGPDEYPIQAERVAVFESYTTGGPGFSGKAAVEMTDVGAAITYMFREEGAEIMHFPEF